MTIVSQPIRILHLEDRIIDAEQVARILKKAQVTCEIKLVSTRAQYTEALKSFNPEIIISDHSLPAFDSIEAIALLKETHLQIPFILVTGTVSEEFAVEAMRGGADDYILKDRLQRLPVAVNSTLEKYRLNQEKQKTEKQLRNIDANSLDMICSVSEDGYFLHVSAASEAILGYKPSELIGRRIFDFTYPEDREKTIQSANRVMGGNLLNNFENRYLRKDGSIVTLSWSARWDEIDRIRYGVARDVTEKNKRDEKIKQAETLLRNIDTNSIDVICTIDHMGRFIYVSSASLKVWGYTPAELAGREFMDFVYDDDKALTNRAHDSVLGGQDITMFENRYVHKNGSIVPTLWSSHYEEKEQIVYCVAKDVTQLKKAEKVIATERKRLYDLFMHAPVSMSITRGKDHVFELANPIYLELVGKSDIIGKAGRDLFPELEKQGLFTHLDNLYETGQTFTANEMFFEIDRDGDGKLSGIYHNILQQPYRDVDGNVAGFFYFGVDVTEQVLARKKIEAAERAVAAEQKQLSQLITNAPVSMCILKGVEHTFELVNPVFIELFGNRDYINRNARDVFPEIEGQGFFEILDEVYKAGTPYTADETVVRIDREANGNVTDIYLNLLFEPYFDADGKVKGIFYFGVDMTEQVLSRKKIEASEQRYRQIVETAQEGIWVIDEHDTTTFVNSKLCEILEYMAEEMLGKPFSFFMDEEGRVLGKDFMEKKKSGQTCQDKIKFISKTGNQIWTHVSSNPLLKDDGAYGGALSMVTDITQQKKIEEENKKLSDVASLTVNAVIVADTEGRITWVNKGFERITEYSFDEVAGKKPGQLLQGTNTDKAVAKYMGECAKNGLGFRVEILNYSKSGRQYWLDIEARPLYDSQNKLAGFMAIEQDITERKIFEATLVNRDNQLTLAAQIAGLGYWEYDVLADLFTFNDQFYDIFKTTAEAVGGYTQSSARYAELFVHPDDREILGKSIADAIQSVDSEFNFKTEHRILYATGEIGYISVHFRIVKDEAGGTVKNFGVNQDITERKKVELERLALIDGLQNKNKDLQQFSYIVSHNLRAPIAKIQGLVSVIEGESEENKFLLEKLNEEAAHLDDVVKDINTIVSARKSPKEKMELVFIATEFNLIKQVLEDRIIASGATIVTDFAAAPEVWTIKSYLYSILYNLTSNAIKYRKPEVPVQIEVQSSQDDKFICIRVKDNGEGIDLVKNGPKVFGLYKRFHTGSVPGKGIGLNLVKTHAESLGGRVEIESELNVGTTFWIYIPRYDRKL